MATRAGRQLVTTAVLAVGLLLCVAGGTSTLGIAPAGADTSSSVLRPRLGAEPSSVHSGTLVTVNANSLAPLTNYQLQVCGNAGFGTSAECDLAATTTAATSETGHFVLRLLVVTPPVPCPCVIKAIPLAGQGGSIEAEVSTPITILGAPMATPRVVPVAESPSGLVVDQADLVGTTSWAEWFGGTPHRTLQLVVRDGGVDPIPSTPVVIRSGPSGSPDQVVSAPVVPPLQPGQVESYQVPVTFPALAHGHYVVAGTLGNTGQIVAFSAPATFMPWGLVVLAALLVIAVLWTVIAGIVRRRRERRASEDAPSVATPGAGPSGETRPTPVDAAPKVTVPSGAEPVEVP